MASIGLFVTSTPANIPSPTANQTWVLNPTTGVLSFWNGSEWVQTSMLYNTAQTTDPTASDNAAAGWPLGSLWTNVVARRTWVSVAAGATAHWEPVGWGSGRFNVLDGASGGFVSTGLLPNLSGAATLSPLVPHGTFYLNGQQLDSANPLGSPATPAGQTFTVSGSEDTYFGIDDTLSVTTQAVAAGAAAPTFASGILPFLRIEGRSLDTPLAPFLTPASGTLVAGTYTYTRTALNALGETIASASASITTTATGGVAITWDTVDGEAGARIYGRSGTLGLLATVAADTLTFTDDGSVTPGVASPTANTTACARYAVPLTRRPALLGSSGFDITRFGAVGDWTAAGGGTDNSALLQSVIEAASNEAALAPGSIVEVFIPAGNFALKSTVVMRAGVRLTGDGTLVNMVQDIYKPFLRFQGGSEGGDLNINANGASGVQLGDPDSPVADPIRVVQLAVTNVGTTTAQATGQQFNGVTVTNGAGVLLGGVVLFGGRQGVVIDGASDCAIQLMRLVNCQNGLLIKNSQRVNVVTLDVETPVVNGVTVDGSNNININGVVWVNQATTGAAATTGPAVSWGPTTACNGVYGNLAITNTGATALALANVEATDLSVTIGAGNFTTGNTLGVVTGLAFGSAIGAHAVVRGVVDATTFYTGTPCALDIVYNGLHQPIISPATALNQAVSLTQIRPVYNVFQFGATGNGSTDDTAAIQAALTAAGNANGGIVYLPVGTYNVSATLTIPTNVTLEGVGKAQDITAPTTPSSVLVWTSTATGTPPVIELGPNTANSCVKNLAIRSTNAMVANGILVNSTRQFLVSQVSMDQVNVAFDMEALSTTNCSEGVIEDIYIYRCNVGMYFEGDTATPTYVTNNVIRNFAVFSAAQSGISLANNCDSNTFFRVEIAEAAGVTSGFNGILAGVSGSADVNRIYFYAVTVSGSNGYAISMSDSSVSFFGVELAGSYNHASIYIAATAFPLHLSESTGNTVPRSIAGTSAGSIKWFESFSNGVHSVTAVFSGYENDTTTNQTIGFDWPFGVGVAITSNNTGLTLAVSGGGLTITTPDSTATYNGVVTISGF